MGVFCCGLPGAMRCHATPRSPAQRSTATEVTSVPLSLTITAGRRRPAGATFSGGKLGGPSWSPRAPYRSVAR
jgi:hypothetical protein